MIDMKKTLFFTSILFGLMSASSCAMFEIDNYDAPSETLRGRVIDAATGEPVLTDQGSEGIRVRLEETSWEGNVTPQDFNCRPDGTFQNTKLFEADYNVRVDGPFIPIVRLSPDGTVLQDDSQNVHIKGVTELEFKVQPFLKVEFVGLPTVDDGQITAKVRVSRAVSKEDFKAAIEPMGNWKDEYSNVTDIQLFVSYSSSVGYRARDEVWSSSIEYNGADFEPLLGTEITIKSNVDRERIPSGRHVFIRAASRINYETAGYKRWNYSEPLEVIIP